MRRERGGIPDAARADVLGGGISVNEEGMAPLFVLFVGLACFDDFLLIWLCPSSSSCGAKPANQQQVFATLKLLQSFKYS